MPQLNRMRPRIPAACIPVFLVIAMLSCIQGILLGKEEEILLRQLIQEFINSPKDGRFDRVIEIPYASAKLIPKVFLWCPMRHNDITIFCPHHGCPLRAAGWTDKLDDSRTDPRNPRLIYDLNGNLILVQAYYECSLLLSGNEKPRHRYLSASAEVMSQLPPHIVRLFPIILQQRCGRLHFACMIT